MTEIEDLCRRALAEDLGAVGDITAQVSVPAGAHGAARIVARESGVLAGIDVAATIFRQLDPDVEFDARCADGAELGPGTVVCEMRGGAAALLAGERTALNFLQRLSGIATRVHAFVAAVAGLPVRILDTRKTTPTLRVLEKAAVVVGGGENHRVGLYDQVLLKENHFAMAGRGYVDTVRAAVAAAAAPVIAEARDEAEALAAVTGGAGVVLLDNLGPGQGLAETTARVRRYAADLGVAVEIEASGGVTLANVRSFAECGVDRISVGSLTHSVDALDLSMLSVDLS